VVEPIFASPASGLFFVEHSSLNRDYTMVMGVTSFYNAPLVIVGIASPDLL